MIEIIEEYEGGDSAKIYVGDNWNKDYPIFIEIKDEEQVASF